MTRLYYVHWDRTECLDDTQVLRDAGHRVRHHWRSEAGQGSKVWNEVKRTPPEVLIIRLDQLPSQGRMVASVTREVRSLRDLPLVFVGGEPGELEQTKNDFPNARFCAREDLLETLERVGASS